MCSLNHDTSVSALVNFMQGTLFVMNFESNTVIEIDLIEICAYLQ